MKRLLLVLTVATLLSSLLPAAEANHTWSGFHWSRATNPFSLTAIDSVTSAWDASLTGAVSDWTASSIFDLTKVAGSTGSRDRKKCNPSAGKIRVCNASYGLNGWLGVAEIWISGNHIVQARTRLNDSYFSKAAYNTPAWRNFVTCQEIGHDFGLDHQDENFDNPNLGTCMDYTNNPTSNQHPNAHDYAELEEIYAHFDIAGASSSSSSSSGQPKGDDHTKVEKDGKYTKVTFILHAHKK